MANFEEIENIIFQFSKDDKIVITSHKDPDGDAIGSTTAWKKALELKGFIPSAVIPNEITDKLSWMYGFDDIVIASKNMEKAKKLLLEANLIIILDYNNSSRSGDLSEEIVKSSAKKIVVDHHPFPDEELADLIISKISVSSTCELSYEVFKNLNWKIDADVAESLYAGIMTDTGMLNHNSNHPQLYKYIAELLEIGIDKAKIHRKIFQSDSIDKIQLFGHSLCNNLNLLSSKKIATIRLTDKELKKFNFKIGDTEGLVNEPLSIKGVDISAFFLEKNSNEVKISFRSVGDYAVNKFSEEYFNGGGHKNAAGGSFKGSIDDAINLFNEKAEDFFNIKKVDDGN